MLTVSFRSGARRFVRVGFGWMRAGSVSVGLWPTLRGRGLDEVGTCRIAAAERSLLLEYFQNDIYVFSVS